VAAPVLCYSLIAPILKAATAQTSRAAFGTPQQLSAERDQRLCKALVMGIALASDVGGMASPISSPQNLFAIEYTPIGWIAWFVVSIPLCTVLNILIWAWLVFCYELPAAESKAVAYALQRDRLDSEKFSPTQYFVMIVSISVVLLWCASVNMQDLTGQMGILGIVPLVLFFGTGILSNEDLNNFLWSVVILAMGGLVLGDSIKSSGLIDVIAENIGNFIEEHSLGLWETFTIFTLLVLVCTTFVSHTVGAIVIIPIVQAIGTQMQPISHAKELVFATALTCSAAMGLPVSGFPNMTAVAVEDNLGNRFLLTKDFLKYAVPASLFSWSVIVTMGYWLIAMSVQIDKL
jgi:di/tricarboxylate transporter